jgi:hypothetical protein
MKIDLKGNWKHYQNPEVCHDNWHMLGTVTRGIGDTGALAQGKRTGLYVQINANALRSLPQRTIATMIANAKEVQVGKARV